MILIQVKVLQVGEHQEIIKETENKFSKPEVASEWLTDVYGDFLDDEYNYEENEKQAEDEARESMGDIIKSAEAEADGLIEIEK